MALLEEPQVRLPELRGACTSGFALSLLPRGEALAGRLGSQRAQESPASFKKTPSLFGARRPSVRVFEGGGRYASVNHRPCLVSHSWGRKDPSKGYRTPDGVWVSSPSYRTRRGESPSRPSFEPVFPAVFEEKEPDLPTIRWRRPAVRLARRRAGEPARATCLSRTPSMDLSQNLRLLSEGQSSADAPAWTDRAVGGPKIRASSELIRHLVQASDPEEVIRLIVDKGQDLTRETSLASPVVEVIKQIKGEAAKIESEPKKTVSSTGARVFSGGQRPSRAARRISGFRPLRGPGATRTSSVGEDRVMKLAGKLRGLIHLAEVENRRDEARKHARLSAEEAPKVEASEATGDQPGGARACTTLIQEIVSAVSREMDLRRERRQEDNHEPWW